MQTASPRPLYDPPALGSRRPTLRIIRRSGIGYVLALAAALSCLIAAPVSRASELRRTPIVQAVQRARPSIVNIRGQKTVNDGASTGGQLDGPRRVNGMGTGVVLDPRGYIITNHHVIDGVARINVTLADGTEYKARLVSRDPKTDLAMIKIDARQPLPVIHIGTSSDLLDGETVVAVGNAYGYEHTVTRGIISALHRTVQVSDTQNYYDLIQTDASINPGNSGGPLLNIDGDMIGINVAVRVGAQGIGFALPVDKVMDVTAGLLSVERIDQTWHGIHAARAASGAVVVQSVDSGSPAAEAGVQAGDVIRVANDQPVHWAFDLERAFLGSEEGREVNLEVLRDGSSRRLGFMLTSLPNKVNRGSDLAWTMLGLQLKSLPDGQLNKSQGRYRGGLVVSDVRSNSPAAEQGIRPGDVLVGMHIWETASMANVDYVLNHSDLAEFDPVKFYVVRGNQTLYGHLRLADQPRARLSRN